MSYAQESWKEIKALKEKIEKCEDPATAILLQSQLLEMLSNVLRDPKFKEGLVKKEV